MDLHQDGLKIRVFENFVWKDTYVGDVDTRVLTIYIVDTLGNKQTDTLAKLNTFIKNNNDDTQKIVTSTADAQGIYKVVIPKEFFYTKGKLICEFQLEKAGNKLGLGMRQFPISHIGF